MSGSPASERLRVAVIGAGAFGRNHARAIRSMADVELAVIVDIDRERGAALAAEFGPAACATDIDQLPDHIDAAIAAVPTSAHEQIAARLLQRGVDVLVEKPIAPTTSAGERLTRLAEGYGRILQVGHLERFNPAVMALERALTVPLFFEVHRLSVFTQRSLDVDVVLDLMIHDLDIVLQFTGDYPTEVRAAGISVLSSKVDIANVRLAFASGCVANLTASRVSTEQVRKLRLFQPGEYISVDYSRQDAVRIAVQPKDGKPDVRFQPMPVEKAEPLMLELQSFFQAVRTRATPVVDGASGTRALRLAEEVLAKIAEHGALVSKTAQTLSR